MAPIERSQKAGTKGNKRTFHTLLCESKTPFHYLATKNNNSTLSESSPLTGNTGTKYRRTDVLHVRIPKNEVHPQLAQIHVSHVYYE